MLEIEKRKLDKQNIMDAWFLDRVRDDYLPVIWPWELGMTYSSSYPQDLIHMYQMTFFMYESEKLKWPQRFESGNWEEVLWDK
jgi:hypothetical protein